VEDWVRTASFLGGLAVLESDEVEGHRFRFSDLREYRRLKLDRISPVVLDNNWGQARQWDEKSAVVFEGPGPGWST